MTNQTVSSCMDIFELKIKVSSLCITKSTTFSQNQRPSHKINDLLAKATINTHLAVQCNRHSTTILYRSSQSQRKIYSLGSND